MHGCVFIMFPEDVSEKQLDSVDWKQGTSDIAKFYFFGEVVKGTRLFLKWF